MAVTKFTDTQEELLNRLVVYDSARRNWDRGVTGVSKGFGTILNDVIEEVSVPLAVQLDDIGSGVTYVGEAEAGSATSAASWRIKEITETGPDISIIWADGNTDFDNIWDNRLALSYS